MITYAYRTIRDDQFRLLKQPRVGCWVDVVAPTNEELTQLVSDFKLDPGQLHDALDPYEVPRIEKENNHLYIFARVPQQSRPTQATLPVLFILGETFFITLSQQETGISQRLRKQRDFCTSQKNKAFMFFMMDILAQYQQAITHIGRRANERLAKAAKLRNEDVVELINNEQVVNEFLSALIPMHEALNRLVEGKLISFFDNDAELIEDVFLTSGQLVTLSKNQLAFLKNSREAYSTIMTNNLNQVIKLFTSLTVVLTLPTIVSSLYGMNIELPFANHPLAFEGIVGSTLIVLILLVWYLWKRDWL